jgi:hypothetical protein
MKKEKLILSFIAVLFGLLVAGISFYFFQNTKTPISNKNNTKIISISPITPTPAPTISLILDKPKDEEVVDSKVLAVTGKTQSNAVITIITDSSEDVITPSETGQFSTTVNLDEGQNILEVISIAPNGESVSIKKTVTYSTEEF